MAIIKCPECGHQVSEKAHVCPSCGVQIAGNIIRCSECGNIYLSDQPMCPVCNAPATQTPTQPRPANVQPAVQPRTYAGGAEPKRGEHTPSQEQEPKKKGGVMALIISLVFAIAVAGVAFYFYNNAKSKQEQEAYEYAINNQDPLVLQQYLDVYKDADPAHRDSIQAHLKALLQLDEDWTNACVAGTRDALEQYLKAHPDSKHKSEVMNKIDSMDYAVAKRNNTPEAWKDYLAKHPDGKYSTEVDALLKEMASKTVQPEEALMVKGQFRKFFQAINSKSEVNLVSLVSETMTNLIGKHDATKDDVIAFMKKWYKDSPVNLNWHILDDYNIEKIANEFGGMDFSVRFSADKIVQTASGQTETQHYVVEGVIDQDGKISSLTMKKVAE